MRYRIVHLFPWTGKCVVPHVGAIQASIPTCDVNKEIKELFDCGILHADWTPKIIERACHHKPKKLSPGTCQNCQVKNRNSDTIGSFD